MQQLKIVVSDRVKDNAAFMDFVKGLPETFDNVGTEIYTARNRLRVTDVSALGVEGVKEVVIKRYHHLLFVQQVQNTFFCKPKGRKAFDNTSELWKRGLSPARELALVEVWHHGLYQYAFFVAELVEGEKFSKLIRKMKADGRRDALEGLIDEYAMFVKRMHEHGVVFQDLNGGNVICKNIANCVGREYDKDRQWHFSLVDTDKAVIYSPERPLYLNVVKKDLIMMQSEWGTDSMFQEKYLRLRGLYTPEAMAFLQKAQKARRERKNHWYIKPLEAYRHFYRRLVKN